MWIVVGLGCRVRWRWHDPYFLDDRSDDSSESTFSFLGTWTMVNILKQVRTKDWVMERLNMSVDTPASWSAHALRTRHHNLVACIYIIWNHIIWNHIWNILGCFLHCIQYNKETVFYKLQPPLASHVCWIYPHTEHNIIPLSSLKETQSHPGWMFVMFFFQITVLLSCFASFSVKSAGSCLQESHQLSQGRTLLIMLSVNEGAWELVGWLADWLAGWCGAQADRLHVRVTKITAALLHLQPWAWQRWINRHNIRPVC